MMMRPQISERRVSKRHLAANYQKNQLAKKQEPKSTISYALYVIFLRLDNSEQAPKTLAAITPQLMM